MDARCEYSILAAMLAPIPKNCHPSGQCRGCWGQKKCGPEPVLDAYERRIDKCERQIASLERENESLKEITSRYHPDTYSHDYNYDSSYYDGGTGEGLADFVCINDHRPVRP